MTSDYQDWLLEFERARDNWRIIRNAIPGHWSSRFRAADEQYRTLRASGGWRSGPASTLGVLGLRALEKHHSRMLGWLLSPTSHHGLGTTFLTSFLATAGVEPFIDPTTVRVELEEPCANDGRTGFADVVVRTHGRTVVIENKIWADQHGRQLDFYVECYGPSSDYIFLTPSRQRPVCEDEGTAALWRRVGWRRDVVPLLGPALGEGDASARGRSAAVDYLVSLEEELFL